MKNIISILVSYLKLCIGGTIVCALLYMVFCNCTTIVSGSRIPIISRFYFVLGVFECFPVFLCIAPEFLVLMLIRNSDKSLVSSCFTAAICVAGFIILGPLCYKLEDLYSRSHFPYRSPSAQTAGVFREDDSVVVYYPYVESDSKANKLLYPKSSYDEYDNISRVVYTEDTDVYKFHSGDFADILLAKAIPMPRTFSFMTQKIKLFLLFMSRMLKEGGTGGYIVYISMGLCLSSIVAVARVHKWRLMNVLAVSIWTSAILVMNYLINCTTRFTSLQFFLLKHFPFGFALHYPLMLLANVIFAVLIVGYGILRHFMAAGDEELEEDTTYGTIGSGGDGIGALENAGGDM